jgi:hypothetical protein
LDRETVTGETSALGLEWLVGTIMNRSIIARGRFSDSQHIELAEPVSEIRGEVEVLIRQIPAAGAGDVFDLIANLAPGSRSKADIDQQIHEERASWGDR